MPDMTGFEVLDELRIQPETAAIPVVIVTSRTLSAFERGRLSAQAIAIIGKENLNDIVIDEAVRRTLKDTGKDTGSLARR